MARTPSDGAVVGAQWRALPAMGHGCACRWGVDWEPGTFWQYHPGSAHWVLAEIVTRVSGVDFKCVCLAAAVGGTVVFVGTPLIVSVETPTKGRGGCSGMTVSPTAARLSKVFFSSVTVPAAADCSAGCAGQ